MALEIRTESLQNFPAHFRDTVWIVVRLRVSTDANYKDANGRQRLILAALSNA